MEIRKGMLRLLQVRIFKNQLQKKILAKTRYCEVSPGLWKTTHQFALIADDFGVKYANKKDAKQLLNALKYHYKVLNDWTGGLYCGITHEQNYKDRYVNILVPGCIKNNSKNIITFN